MNTIVNVKIHNLNLADLPMLNQCIERAYHYAQGTDRTQVDVSITCTEPDRDGSLHYIMVYPWIVIGALKRTPDSPIEFHS